MDKAKRQNKRVNDSEGLLRGLVLLSKVFTDFESWPEFVPMMRKAEIAQRG